MPQRNGQNPIRAAKTFQHNAGKGNDEPAIHSKTVNPAGICPACKAEVPARPGFRISSLKCPKCGTSLGKK